MSNSLNILKPFAEFQMNIIYFAPYNISEKKYIPLNRAPRIRSWQIYRELTKVCNVTIICGNTFERFSKIIKILFKLGTYDGLYMESANCTLKKIDYFFLKQVKKRKIPMSMFLRDIFWQFPVYKEQFEDKRKLDRKIQSRNKELAFFKEQFDIIYSQSPEFAEYAKLNKNDLLPPAGEVLNIDKGDFAGILFSGSTKRGFESLLEANRILLDKGYEIPFYIVSSNKSIDLEKNMLLFDEITEEIVKKSSIGIIPLDVTGYYRMTISLKFMQYLSYGLPIICRKSPTFTRYNDRYNICEYFDGSPEDLADKILLLYQNQNILKEKSQNALNAVKNDENWGNRVFTILNDLRKIREKMRKSG